MRTQMDKKKGFHNSHSNTLNTKNNESSSFIKPTVQSMMLSGKNSEASENEDKVAAKNSEETEKEPTTQNVEKSSESEKEGEVSSSNEEEATTPAAAPAVDIGNVNADSTPAGMPDRLPPRVDTDVDVKVSGHLADMNNVQFSVEGGSAANGEATVNGAASATQNSDGTLRIKGTTQTSPGSAGNLTVVAKQDGNVLATSNTFSVSSIPQNFSSAFNELLNTGANWGVKVDNSWESDSGNTADLDEAERSESVESKSADGVFSAVALNAHNSGYRPGDVLPRSDSHTLGPVDTLRRLHGNGTIVSEQAFMFWDKRTGATDITATNSGFRITKELAYDAAGPTTTLTTTKEGADVDANGNRTGAGAGRVSEPLVL